MTITFKDKRAFRDMLLKLYPGFSFEVALKIYCHENNRNYEEIVRWF